MANKEELVIRWLDDPVEAKCAFCKGEKLRKFKKGPVVSVISGELVCPRCAVMNDKNLWDVCSRYAQYAIEHDQEMLFDDLKLDKIDLSEPISNTELDIDFLKADKMNQLDKVDFLTLPEIPLFENEKNVINVPIHFSDEMITSIPCSLCVFLLLRIIHLRAEEP